MGVLLATTEADLPFVQGVVEQLQRLFGVTSEAGVASADPLPDSLVLERKTGARRKRRAMFQVVTRLHAHGPLATRPFKFKLTTSSTTDDPATDETALRISVAGQLLPFFAPHRATRPPPVHVTVVHRDCGPELAARVAEALEWERFEVDVQPEPPADGAFLAPGPLGAKGQLTRAAVRIKGTEEKWPALKASGDELLDQVAEKFAERYRALR